jgi:hypothetical protein
MSPRDELAHNNNTKKIGISVYYLPWSSFATR